MVLLIRLPSAIKNVLLSLVLMTVLVRGTPAEPTQTTDPKTAQDKQEKTVKITEEILVVGKTPKEIPLATVSTIQRLTIEQIKPRDLSEVIKYVPGSMVTFGDKDTYTLKLRGIDARRIVLLIDGIPVYEPYFSTFDLKTVSAGGVESIQVTKGPSSVLYGPNTLGGLVNVITRRPGDTPHLSLTGSFGDGRTKGFGFDTAYRWRRFALSANALYQDSDGFYYPHESEGRTPRTNSDYERISLNAKFFYTPSRSTELLINGSIYQSAYGMPAALFSQRARYWRFPKWDRYTLNAGGFTSLGGDATLRFRTFIVNHINTLDWFDDPEMTVLRSQSTYDNSVYGVFAMADVPTGRKNDVKASLLFQRDIARIQDDAGLPWEVYDQGTFSAGIESHFDLDDRWIIVGGLSLDVIDKFEEGDNNTSLNPLIGVKFTPSEELDFHLSFARKSKFPSMRSMYSPSSGNPDLLAESGTSLEFSATFNKGVFLTGTVFFNQFRDFIDSVRLPDGTRQYFNVGRAHINGFEVQAQKSLLGFSMTVNYTFLGHRNDTDDRHLDAQSKHNINFDISIFPVKTLRIGLYGLYGSKSWWYDVFSQTTWGIPGYVNLDAVVSYALGGRGEIFFKIGNVFDRYFYTEPGFPWRGRYAEAGFRADIFK